LRESSVPHWEHQLTPNSRAPQAAQRSAVTRLVSTRVVADFSR
jgi:hypothetical protein